MLLILISLIWCAIAVLAVALCCAAARGDRDGGLLGTDARKAAVPVAGPEQLIAIDASSLIRVARTPRPAAVFGRPARV